VIIKLPKGYYEYKDTDIEKLDRKTEDQILSISLSAFIACKFEQYALLAQEPMQTIIKKILIEEGVLKNEDVTIGSRKKANSKFFGMDCEELKKIGTTKLIRVEVSKYAKAKVYNRLVDEGYDLTFFIKKSLIKKANQKSYQILEINELDM